MTAVMNPTEVYEALRKSYLRYLETSFHLKDENLLRQFKELLRDKTQPPLVRRPILEVSPGFKAGGSLEKLIQEGILSRKFQKFSEDDGLAKTLKRSLYFHQESALKKIIKDNRNLVVATGTGSGKTETFLYPIINHLLRESEAGSLSSPGVRALLLYPMNALANDQISRLRAVAKLFPEITFGRYTGETDQEYSEALRSYHAYHGGQDPLKNELICRDEMQAAAPHILFTNYAMLEYLLIRPKDSSLFSGGHWRFLVLDEVHTYSGALGIEIAMLLRRLKERVVKSEKGRLQCIATSATLGEGEKDFPSIANFATGLFGEDFNAEDIIRAYPPDMSVSGQAWGIGKPEMYSSLKNEIFKNEIKPIELLVEVAKSFDVPIQVLNTCIEKIENLKGKDRYKAFLYHLMEGDQRVRELREKLNEERALELKRGVLDMSESEIVDLVALGSYARKPGDDIPLISARYHIMARAISGVYGWFDAGGKLQLLNRREKRHEHGGREYAVFELASCNRCGEVMIVGKEEGVCIVQPPDVGDDPIAKLVWFHLRPASDVVSVDEDDLFEEDEAKYGKRFDQLSPMSLCRICGRIDDKNTFDEGGCDGHIAEVISVFRIQNKPDRHVPRRCSSCWNVYGSVASRVMTGKQAPVAVLVTSLYQKIPESIKEEEIYFPGGGRKLMVFSDSRQDAAFFAPFIDNTYNKLKQRRYLFNALGEEWIDLQDWVQKARVAANSFGEWGEESSDSFKRKDAGRWVLREWTATDRRLALEGSGSIIFRLRRPGTFSRIQELSESPWNLDEEQQWLLIQVLLDTIRYQGIVSFDDDAFSGISHDDGFFAPRNVACYVRGSKGVSQKRIYAWEPAKGASNKRLDYLYRLLIRRGVSEEEAKQKSIYVLQKLWSLISQPNSPLRKLFECGVHDRYKKETNLFRLKPEHWEVRRAGEDMFRCSTCGTVTAFSLSNVCPMTACTGSVEHYPVEKRIHNHYYNLFTNMAPIPLNVSEHTAQLTKKKAFEAQEDFINGKVNLLSCTTTFEMGVDVGDLQTVFMRNMPPNPGNYVQRAGRAGRRVDNVAVIVSFAQRRTHDFAYFDNWRKMVGGSVRPPSIHLNNTKIMRRHIHAEAIADWLRENPQVFKDRVDDLFDPSSSNVDEINKYLEKHPKNLENKLKRIIPTHLHDEIGLSNWLWFDGVGMSEEDGRECFLKRLRHAADDVRADWEALVSGQKNALKNAEGRKADNFLQQLNTLKGRSLIGKLGTYGLMPKYGFPTEVVELRVRSASKESKDIELQRDMKLALSEFAPENEVIAGGKIWKSSAIVLPIGDRKLHKFNYWHCQKCRFFSVDKKVSTGLQFGINKDCNCGNSIKPEIYIYPEFGFSTAANDGKNVGEDRPGLKSYSDIFFHDDSDGLDPIAIPGVNKVHYRESGQGWIYVINNNQGKDFYICELCGYSTRSPIMESHVKPYSSDQDCQNTELKKHGLGFSYRTDVLELHFPFDGVRTDDWRSLWLSVLYALVNGACQALNINERDIDGCLYYSRKRSQPSLVLFDTSPGGAGFVYQIRDHFHEVMKRALKILECRSCGEDSSCIACLRNYFNQREHNLLRRGLAKNYLETL